MATHFSDIGFPVQSSQEMIRLAMQTAEQGEHLISPHGEYIVWSPGAGVELWAQVVGGQTIVDLTPHFAGVSRTLLGMTDWLPEATNPLQGALAGWAGSRVGSAGATYAITANVPDFDRHAHQLAVPSVVTVQIAAFARQLASFTNDEAYFATQHNNIKVTSEACLPLGGPLSPFGEQAPPDAVPGSVLLSGHIRQVEQRLNPITFLPFYVLLIHVQDGQFDVVADAALFQTPPLPGGVLQGAFWLSARLVSAV